MQKRLLKFKVHQATNCHLHLHFNYFFFINPGYAGKKFFQTDIAKVISDYPNSVRNISGDQLIGNRQAIEFESRVEIKDASLKNKKKSKSQIPTEGLGVSDINLH